MSIFKGAGVAIATPMKEDGTINFEAFGKLIETQVQGHTDAIIAVGTSGEASTLEDDEHMEAVRYCIDKVAGRIPVIAGTGSNNTAHAVMMSKLAQQAGADGCLVVTPYYNKATQDGLIASYTAIASAVDIPIIMYNVPSRTGCNIQPETAAYLGKHVDNIVAIKEASGNISQIAHTIELAEGSLDVISGNDDQIVPIMALGGIGVISVLSNVAPRFTHDMCQLCLDGDFAAARKMQIRALPLIRALFSEVNPIPVKAALNMLGIEAGIPRLPLTEMRPEHQAVLRAELENMGLL
ncbi:MAG: 4-hydroxy-tetrahydrodipicolinate synthase [Lachnospiraceae bacterium]|jgi:4-hydroxy-tetrahydrodipicolinate synthase|nr:4-hydroxy-tetrahydrodipicolinate synthase [Lachnospiraceae bacterium]MCI1657008.1 4-hydroxy-tetrahydrodipicolinate synthase [Lachnospiraceae bacterium]MCI2195567.1 4-hydroxy-tetrahydrodipicolinate synthase [Lachnospiraceae bacterium]